MGKSVGNLFGVFGLKTSQFQKQLKNLERSIKKSTRSFKKIGESINKNFTLPLIAVSAASFKMSKDFNESMSNVATLIPDNIKRINSLKDSIQDLSIKSGESTSELSEGLYNVVSALGDSSESMDTLELATKSAKAGVGSIDDAIGLLSATTKGYGDTTFAAQKKVADFAQMTIKLGQTTLADLGVSIQQVTSLSNELGVSQEELFSSFSSTTGVLGNASIVATQYKATLKALINPKKDLIKLYKKMGIESGKQLIAQEGLQGALKLIAKHAKDTKLPLQKLVGSAEAVAFALSLTGAQAKKFKSDLDAMRKSAGALDEAFRQKTEGIAKLGFQYDRLIQRIKVTIQIMGDALGPAITRISEYIEPLSVGIKLTAENFKGLSKETKNIVFDFALLVSGAGLTFSALGALGSVSGVAVAGLSKLLPTFRTGTKTVINGEQIVVTYNVKFA
ncbi:MAG: phage tail tape measure protein [Immundisolibacteraceae bacterium]|nr:phage tail tape measure protein [Immundisolibacteraceae bacterium]